MIIDRTAYDQDTLFKVYRALKACDLKEDQQANIVTELQNHGILFRERVPEGVQDLMDGKFQQTETLF